MTRAPLLALSSLASFGIVGPVPAQDVQPGLAATYVCAAGALLQVAYLNPAPDLSLAVVAYGGRLIPMRAGPTGSGVRYVAYDLDPGYVWHSKGEAGTLFVQGAAADGPQETVLADCRKIDGPQ